MGKLADQLNELSKRDDIIIVGSEIRAALQELKQENADLRAQLARCVSAISNNELFDEDYRNEFVGSLPATAKHDAEILRLVDKGLVSIGNGEWCIRITEQQEIASAVRAREEAMK